jgi:hypothetical protein
MSRLKMVAAELSSDSKVLRTAPKSAASMMPSNPGGTSSRMSTG